MKELDFIFMYHKYWIISSLYRESQFSRKNTTILLIAYLNVQQMAWQEHLILLFVSVVFFALYLWSLRDFSHFLTLPLLRHAFSILGPVNVPAHGQHTLQGLSNWPSVNLFFLKHRDRNREQGLKSRSLNLYLISSLLILFTNATFCTFSVKAL